MDLELKDEKVLVTARQFPAKFANAAVFLCSTTASFIKGVMLPVDGGTSQFPL